MTRISKSSTSAAPTGDGWIETPAQLRALASPARQEILDALAAAGPCSMSALAALLGRPADGLYFHVRRLHKAGLVIEVDPQPAGRRMASVYDVAQRPLEIRPDRASPALLARIVGAALRLGLRDYRRAVQQPTERRVAHGPGLAGGRLKGWVGPDDLQRVHAIIQELKAILRRNRPADGLQLHAFTYAWTPVSTSRRKQRSAATKSGEQKAARAAVSPANSRSTSNGDSE